MKVINSPSEMREWSMAKQKVNKTIGLVPTMGFLHEGHLNLIRLIKKMCDEVVRVFCATANPITVLSVETNDGAGIIGVVDGIFPKGVEDEEDIKKRRDFLKKIGYKF